MFCALGLGVPLRRPLKNERMEEVGGGGGTQSHVDVRLYFDDWYPPPIKQRKIGRFMNDRGKSGCLLASTAWPGYVEREGEGSD